MLAYTSEVAASREDAAPPPAPTATTAPNLARALGNASVALLASRNPEWTVSMPGDADELAADRIAHAAAATPRPFTALGHDFTGVRLHTDAAAADVARGWMPRP